MNIHFWCFSFSKTAYVGMKIDKFGSVGAVKSRGMRYLCKKMIQS